MKKNNIINYYDNIYEEDKRLSNGCDNRHIVEREVKLSIYRKILSTYPKGSRILDISCGTGLYSIELANMGYDVFACDLCRKHIDILNKNTKSLNLNIKTDVCDAMSLPYCHNSFDLVLLAGAIYHLQPEEKVKAINEAINVCKVGGDILVDFLPQLHSLYQNVARYGDTEPELDDIFSYDSKKDMKSYLNDNVALEGFYSTDGITRLIEYKVNNMTKEQLDRYITFCFKNSINQEIVDMSEHAIMDIIKIK